MVEEHDANKMGVSGLPRRVDSADHMVAVHYVITMGVLNSHKPVDDV